MKLHDGIDINNVTPITEDDYFARGTTALLDAIGKTIVDLGIKSSTTSNYVADEQGTEVFYSSLVENVASFRAEGQIEEDWSININNDLNRRKGSF